MGQTRQLDGGINAGATTVMTPMQSEGEDVLCIDINDNAIVTRATIAIATMEKMPAHQRRQRQLAGEQQGQ
jgi:hypothetical protein